MINYVVKYIVMCTCQACDLKRIMNGYASLRSDIVMAGLLLTLPII